jgi:hypothetical protein
MRWLALLLQIVIPANIGAALVFMMGLNIEARHPWPQQHLSYRPSVV